MKALLLEGNLISSLPPELGQLTGLTGLNLSGNPLTVPPQSVVEQGTKVL
jgi:Leucine-rich repeat (LRR) protein